MTKREKVAAIVGAVVVPGGIVGAGLWWWWRRSVLTGEDKAKLEELSPRFRKMATSVLEDVHHAGLHYFLGDGYRSPEKSADLYAAYKAGGPRAAPPGESPHNYREALDVNLTDEHGKVIQTVEDPAYQTFAGIIRKRGAVWGGDFTSGPKDGPHFEHPDWRELRDASGEAVA